MDPPPSVSNSLVRHCLPDEFRLIIFLFLFPFSLFLFKNKKRKTKQKTFQQKFYFPSPLPPLFVLIRPPTAIEFSFTWDASSTMATNSSRAKRPFFFSFQLWICLYWIFSTRLLFPPFSVHARTIPNNQHDTIPRPTDMVISLLLCRVSASCFTRERSISWKWFDLKGPAGLLTGVPALLIFIFHFDCVN